jgi:uncharacterized protein YggE
MCRFVLSLAIPVFAAMSVLGQVPTQPKPPTIDVTGTAEIQLAPDEVVFTLDVTKRNKDMNLAKREADAALAKIIDLTKTFGIAPQNVRTDYISVDMRYQFVRDPKNRIFDEDGDEIGTRTFLGYDVSTTVIVRLTDIKRFEEFFSEVMKTGLTEVDNVRFESSQFVEQRKKAREMAMKAAYEKAAAMAGAVNQTIGKAIYIAETNPTDNRYLSNAVNSNISTGPVTVTQSVASFSPGSIKINAQVSVTFLLN